MPNDMTPMPLEATPFDIMTFLEGRSQAWGVFEDRFRNARRRFCADLIGAWKDGAFILDETFRFDDGSTEQRTWRLVRDTSDPQKFTATADDVVGTAQGKMDGDTARMRYSFTIRSGGFELLTSFDDRFYKVDDDCVVNRAVVTKWGVRVGDLSVFFKRVPSEHDQRRAA